MCVRVFGDLCETWSGGCGGWSDEQCWIMFYVGVQREYFENDSVQCACACVI